MMSSKNGISSDVILALIVTTLAFKAVETSAINIAANTYFVEEADSSARVDPLHSFKLYRGGYDITNKHYWSSIVFAGVYGYAIGVLWLLCGIIFSGISVLNKTRTKKKKNGPSCLKQGYLCSILTVTFLSLLAMVASGVVIGGNARFYSEANKIADIVINTANEASHTIHNTTEAMKAMRDNDMESSEVQDFLASKSHQLDIEAANLQKHANKNRLRIDNGLNTIFIVVTLIVSVNLVAMIALLVCGILRLHRVLGMLITVCWCMTVMCWFFFGIYFSFHKLGSDTCNALHSFERNAYNSSLSRIVPCHELLSAKSTLRDVSARIHNLVNQVNADISVQKPSIPFSICNPFSEPPRYVYAPENCPSTSVKIGDISKLLKVYACPESEKERCREAEWYSNSMQKLLDVYPEIESLLECKPVKEAFSEIRLRHCPKFNNFVRIVWASMLFLSLLMTLLLLFSIDHHRSPHLVYIHDTPNSLI